MFNNLLYILAVIVTLEMGDAPPVPARPLFAALSILMLKGLIFWLLLHLYPALRKLRTSTDYSRTETSLSILAVLVFMVDVYLLDLHYYLGFIPFTKQLPILGKIAGLTLFYIYLGLVWLVLRRHYENIFTATRPAPAFLQEQFRNSLIMVIPWLLLSVLADLLYLLPIRSWQNLLAGNWGDVLIVLVFLSTLPFWYPALLVRMTGCHPLPPGEPRERIEAFCRGQRVSFREIYYWPLLGGRALSAGVVGIVGRFRYLLLTPALLEVAEEKELEAVIAHEIGHIRKHHLVLYLLLFMGFGIVIQLVLDPLLHALMESTFFVALLLDPEVNPSTVMSFLVGIPMLLVMLLYFRFVFGFFMRNFERQADLYSYLAMGEARPLISILEKIAWLGGDVRNRSNWHHFGIGQRIDYLKDCQDGRKKPLLHELKVYGSLATFTLIFAVALTAAWQLQQYLATIAHPGAAFAEGFLASKIEAEPANPLWLLLQGDMLAGKKRYPEAIEAYEKSLALRADNPEVLNNLAWLLLTAEKPPWRDPGRGLLLARKAAALSDRSHILDTLAEAQWQNGESAKAVQTERRALTNAPENRDYYQGQLKKFQATPPS